MDDFIIGKKFLHKKVKKDNNYTNFGDNNFHIYLPFHKQFDENMITNPNN